MALRFSAVKLTAQEKSCELLVGGVPTGYEDLTGWTAFDNFLKDIDDEDKVNVQVDTYLYGEGEIVDADPVEVAYMKKDFHSHRVPQDVYHGKRGFELASMRLCQILTVEFGWDSSKSYRIPGRLVEDKKIVVFDLRSALKIGE